MAGTVRGVGLEKNLMASLDQSLQRMGLEYVDIFYSHRPDADTPFEEAMEALDQAVRQGKALYAGLSNYTAEQTKEAVGILKQMGRRCLIHQPKYSMFVRWIEEGLLDVLEKEGIGCIAFSPLAQGLLTEKYLNGIPADSRAAKETGFLQQKEVTEEKIKQVKALQAVAQQRGQTITQMALAWVLRDARVTSALIGASSVKQLQENLTTLENLEFSKEELKKIEAILK